MEDNSVPQSLSYGDLENLASALHSAVQAHLMSLEEARAIWKRHLVQVGWKMAGVLRKEEKPKTETKKAEGGEK